MKECCLNSISTRCGHRKSLHCVETSVRICAVSTDDRPRSCGERGRLAENGAAAPIIRGSLCYADAFTLRCARARGWGDECECFDRNSLEKASNIIRRATQLRSPLLRTKEMCDKPMCQMSFVLASVLMPFLMAFLPATPESLRTLIRPLSHVSH